MGTHIIAITRDPITGRNSILVDGHEIADAVQAYVLRASANTVPSVELTLQALEIDREGETDIWVSDATQALLLRLGWTPPPTSSVVEVEGVPT